MWKIIRIILLLLCCIAGYLSFFRLEALTVETTGMLFFVILIVVFGFGIIMTPFILIAFLYLYDFLSPFCRDEWELPKWNRCFFDLGDPVHLFHILAWTQIAMGCSRLLTCWFILSSIDIFAVSQLCNAGSIFLGIRLARKVFKKKYHRVDGANDSRVTDR